VSLVVGLNINASYNLISELFFIS